MPLAAALAMAGRTAEAFATLDRAEPALAGGEAAQAAAQRGSVLAFVGRNSEALAAYGHALPGLRAAGDDVYCGHVLANRGVIHMLRADLRRARANMTAARRHYERAGQDSAAASMTNNLGVVAVRAGDLPLALELFEAAAHADELLGRSTDLLLPDRAQALLAAGLSDEAAATCRRSAAALEGAGTAPRPPWRGCRRRRPTSSGSGSRRPTEPLGGPPSCCRTRTAPASRRWPRASRSPPAPVPVTGTRTTWSWRRRWHDGWRTRGTCSARRRPA